MRGLYILASLVVATPAIARPPAYAHKAGATPVQLEEEQVACWNDGMHAMKDPKWQNPWVPNPVTESTAAGAAGGAMARGFAQGIEDGKRFKTTYYECLIAKGYTLRRPSDVDWKAYKKLKKPERQALMANWSAAPVALHPQAPKDEFD